MRFVLTKGDYDRPSTTSVKAEFMKASPEVFAEAQRKRQEVRELAESIPTGILSLRILSYEVDPTTGYPLRIGFSAQLTAPKAFRFARRFNPRSARGGPGR